MPQIMQPAAFVDASVRKSVRAPAVHHAVEPLPCVNLSRPAVGSGGGSAIVAICARAVLETVQEFARVSAVGVHFGLLLAVDKKTKNCLMRQ